MTEPILNQVQTEFGSATPAPSLNSEKFLQ